MKNITYFVFGGAASSEYHDLPFSEFLKWAKRPQSDIAISQFDSDSDTPQSLLEKYDGFSGYAVITPEEFEQLKSLDICEI